MNRVLTIQSSIFQSSLHYYQKQYSTIKKKAFALLLALQHFDLYIGGSATPLLVYTDHNPLTFLAQMSNANQSLIRWALTVQEYNLDIRQMKGSKNVIVDALSRENSTEI